jgi:hypothetical protein
MRTTLLVLLIPAVMVFGRAGPNTATQVALVSKECKLSVKMGMRRCPSPVEVNATVQLPSPGYDLTVVKRTVDRETRRVRIELRATPKPGDNDWPQVMTPVTAKIDLGVLRKGRYALEVHYQIGAQGKSKLIHATVLEGR